MERISIKAKARYDLGGKLFCEKWLSAVLFVFVFGIIAGLGEVFINGGSSSIQPGQTLDPSKVPFIIGASVLGLAFAIATLPMFYGNAKNFLSVTRGASSSVGTMFHGYTENGSRNFATAFFVSLFSTLWSLLLIIPGIVKYYSYSMSFYILVDHPEYDWKTAITESRKMMNGHKWELFVLDLSFIGWFIVGSLCLGVGLLWAYSYYEAARANFYNEISGYNASAVEE